MNRNIKITLLLCFSLVLMFGSAQGDNTQGDNTQGDNTQGDNTQGDNTPVNSTPDNSTPDELTGELFSEGDGVGNETDDIPPFEGAIGPEHALYGLKIAFGNINETFTYNSSERLGLQVSRARHRIAEARAEIKNGNDKAAGVALGHYKKIMDNIGDNVNGSDINSTDLVKANEKMSKHQNTLQYMVLQKKAQGKDVEGLTDALNNSLMLQDKLGNKLEEKLQKGDAGHGSMKEQLDKPVNTQKEQKDQKESNGKNMRR